MRGSGSGAEEEVGGRISEAASVVDPIAAHQADEVAGLVGQHAPAVALLLEHPPVTVEWLADLGRPHGRVRSKHGALIVPGSPVLTAGRGHLDGMAGGESSRPSQRVAQVAGQGIGSPSVTEPAIFRGVCVALLSSSLSFLVLG